MANSRTPFSHNAHRTIMGPQTDFLVARGCAAFGQHQESQPLTGSDFMNMHREFFCTLNQSDLSDLTLSMRSVMGSL